MGILRLSHVEVRVPDLELATAYYTEVLVLLETGRDTERVFLKCWDEHEHHSVILRYAATYGLEHMGFKVEHLDDLEHYEQRVEKDGCRVTRHARGLNSSGVVLARMNSVTGRTLACLSCALSPCSSSPCWS